MQKVFMKYCLIQSLNIFLMNRKLPSQKIPFIEIFNLPYMAEEAEPVLMLLYSTLIKMQQLLFHFQN